ncbi:HEC/Ndc80p family-domain-containing protein [Cladochytrium replicatum]|nr:HEC/Ndc80p family-domain-containing protein [Cladochytrium replicatum]
MNFVCVLPPCRDSPISSHINWHMEGYSRQWVAPSRDGRPSLLPQQALQSYAYTPQPYVIQKQQHQISQPQFQTSMQTPAHRTSGVRSSLGVGNLLDGFASMNINPFGGHSSSFGAANSSSYNQISSFSATPGGVSDPRISLSSVFGGVQPTARHLGAISRRSSAFASRLSIAGNPTGGQSGLPSKDPRNLRDKQWQANAIRTLIQFLVQSGFSQAVSMKTLQSPTAKDFQAIFKFIYQKIDEHYVYQKKFEEEVPTILKGVRYPYADGISKSNLYAVGSMHAWPLFLGVLMWMVELVLCGDKISVDGDGDVDDMVVDGQRVDHTFYDYLIRSYDNFLQGTDDFETMDAELMETFDRKNESIIADIERFKKATATLEKELNTLTNVESPLQNEERIRSTLVRDIQSLKEHISAVDSKKQRHKDTCAKLRDHIKSSEDELARLVEEKRRLHVIVDGQEMSPADVERMTSEREQLMQALKLQTGQTKEKTETFLKMEISGQKIVDQLERQIQSFNSLAYRLQLTEISPSGALGVPGTAQLIAIAMGGPTAVPELEFRAQVARPDQIISLDLKNAIRPMLIKLKSHFNASAHRVHEDSMAVQETLDRLTETYAERMEEVHNIANQKRKEEDRYKDEKQMIAAHTDASKDEIESLEQEIHHMRTDCRNELRLVQQKSSKVAAEYEELLKRHQDHQARAVNQLVKTLDDLIAFRTYISESLTDIKQMVEEDLRNTETSEQSELAEFSSGNLSALPMTPSRSVAYAHNSKYDGALPVSRGDKVSAL